MTISNEYCNNAAVLIRHLIADSTVRVHTSCEVHLSTHSQISLSAGLLQSPLMFIKILFLLQGFRQVLHVPHPDICGFPAAPWEKVFLDIWLYPLVFLFVAIVKCDVLQKKSLQNHRGLIHLTSTFQCQHLCLN